MTETTTPTNEAQWNALADAIRAALQAAHEAGYRRGRYVSDQSTEEDVLRDAKDAAQVREETATRAVWHAFYGAAESPLAAPATKPRTCWCGRTATWLQSIDPMVTPWDETTRTSDGQPAAVRCDEHTADSFGAAEAL